jgi:hypothetical protein
MPLKGFAGRLLTLTGWCFPNDVDQHIDAPVVITLGILLRRCIRRN